MKNKYESIIIISGKLIEEDYKKSLESIIERIKSFIEIEKIEEIGKKKLAYEVKENKEGWYVVFYFNAQSQAISELERIYRITDDVIKFITIRIGD